MCVHHVGSLLELYNDLTCVCEHTAVVVVKVPDCFVVVDTAAFVFVHRWGCM